MSIKQRHLAGLNIAVLVDGKSKLEDLAVPREALEQSGAMVKIIAERKGGMGADAGQTVDLSFEQARADDFDGVLVPGGSAALKSLQGHPDAARILRGMEKEGKPIGLVQGDAGAATQGFMQALAKRTMDSVRGTADALPGAASMGG